MLASDCVTSLNLGSSDLSLCDQIKVMRFSGGHRRADASFPARRLRHVTSARLIIGDVGLGHVVKVASAWLVYRKAAVFLSVMNKYLGEEASQRRLCRHPVWGGPAPHAPCPAMSPEPACSTSSRGDLMALSRVSRSFYNDQSKFSPVTCIGLDSCICIQRVIIQYSHDLSRGSDRSSVGHWELLRVGSRDLSTCLF